MASAVSDRMKAWLRLGRALRARLERRLRASHADFAWIVESVPPVTRVHRLEQVITAFVTNLAHDDPVWTMAKCCCQHSSLGVMATWPGISSTASHRTAFG